MISHLQIKILYTKIIKLCIFTANQKVFKRYVKLRLFYVKHYWKNELSKICSFCLYVWKETLLMHVCQTFIHSSCQSHFLLLPEENFCSTENNFGKPIKYLTTLFCLTLLKWRLSPTLTVPNQNLVDSVRLFKDPFDLSQSVVI